MNIFEKKNKESFQYLEMGAFCPHCGLTTALPNITFTVMQETHRYLEDIEVEVDPGRIMVNDPRNSVVQVFCGRCMKERGCKEPMIPVDYPLTNILAELNQMGAYTLFSCYGHNMALTAYTEDPYIRFAEPFTSELSKILLTFYWEKGNGIKTGVFQDYTKHISLADYQEYIRQLEKANLRPLFQFDSDELICGKLRTIRIDNEFPKRKKAFDLIMENISGTDAGVKYCDMVKAKYPNGYYQAYDAYFES